MERRRQAAVWWPVAMGVAAVVGVIGLALFSRPETYSPERSAPASQPESEYGYEDGSGSEDLLDRPRAELEAAAGQWPDSPQEQMHGMNDRLMRVADTLNTAAGSRCVVMLGQTHRAAVSHGNGIITLDTYMLWRLSEDALACLLAHEIGHEMLGHQRQLERLATDKGRPGYEQRMRAIELAADEFAGRLVARAGYQPRGFSELLKHVRSTAWETPLIRQYYPHPRRIAAFRQGFDLTCQRAPAQPTSQPAGAEKSEDTDTK